MAERRRIPTVVVLAAASAMVSIGVVGFFAATRSGEPSSDEHPTGPNEIPVDTRTPEAAAESFLDAWRKREHRICRDLSVGEALEAVLLREEEDATLTAEERALKEQVWDTMASERLRLELIESETLSAGRLVLRGNMTGEFLGRPYVRAVQFTMEKVGEDWMVARMDLGEILSDVPDFLDVESQGRDPSEFEMRGEDVP
jgi:hypothetical protein